MAANIFRENVPETCQNSWLVIPGLPEETTAHQCDVEFGELFFYFRKDWTLLWCDVAGDIER